MATAEAPGTVPGRPASGSTAGQPQPRHQHLVALLTFASGCVDAASLMALGGAFTSVITGNLIFIGRAIGTSSLTPAVHAVLAVAGYIAGVMIGSRVAHRVARTRPRPPEAWPIGSTAVLAVEAVILAALNAAWLGVRAEPGGRTADVMLVFAALALGMQGAAARAVRGTPSTTYMTGALTALFEALATGRRHAVDVSAAVGLVSLIAGAAVAAILVDRAPRFALLPPLVAILAVVAVKQRDHRLNAGSTA